MNIFGRQKVFLAVLFCVLLCGGFLAGWLVKAKHSKEKARSILENSAPLRLGGFQFIQPVLLCDTSPNKDLPKIVSLRAKLENLIAQEKAQKNIDAISIYFQDFNTDGRLDINKDEKFHPASIVKIPLMIAYYKLAQANSNAFSFRVKCVGGEDQNISQEIKPKEFVEVGNVYTVQNLIEKMIKYSDNNALSLLNNFMSTSTLGAIYTDLSVPAPLEKLLPGNLDYITTKDISYFFRILYNATYLNREMSENVLKLLSETDYNNGLAAGVPAGIKVAHKFGQKTVRYSLGGDVDVRELHDCGIIYHPTSPYLLCVMTKSSADLVNIEKTIKNVSSLVYDEVSKP